MGNNQSALPPILGDLVKDSQKEIRKYSAVEPHKPPPPGTYDPNAPRTSIMDGPTNPSMEFDLESKPSAIVVGAGIPGVHIAYELAKRGFEVEVIEAQSNAGSGNSPFMFPEVGGVFSPTAFDRLSYSETLKHVVGMSSADPWIRFPDFRSAIYGRSEFKKHVKCLGIVKSTRDEIVSMGTSLTTGSAARVRELLHDHPELRASVVGIDGPKMPLPPPNVPLTIRPLRWTQTLAKICTEKYNVRFTFDTEVTSVISSEFSDERVISGLATRGSEGGVRSVGAKRADLYVFAAGVSNPAILNYLVGSSPLIVTKDTAAVFELKRKADAPARPTTRLIECLRASVGDHVAKYLNQDGTVRYQPSELNFSTSTSTESGMLVGGQTIEPKYFPCTEKGKPLDVFTTIIDRLAAVGSLPSLTSIYQSAKNDLDAEAKQFHCYSFYKTVTPDGLPVATRIGPIFNAFVIGGFGSRSPALAPQAARGLGDLIVDPSSSKARSELLRYDPTSAGLKSQPRIRTAEERVRDDTRSLFTRTVGFLNNSISVPISTFTHSVALSMMTSEAVPLSVRDYIYQHYVTAEDEVRLTGHMPTTPLQSFPRITPDTVLQPPDLPKSMDYKENVVKKREI